jgi:hypothetical protein
VTFPVVPSPRLPKDTLLALFKSLSGVQCYWRSAKRPAMTGLGPQPGERAWIDLQVSAFGAIGVDELRSVFNPARNSNDMIIAGQRAFTVTLKCRSLDPRLEAFDLAERVRFRMRSQHARGFMIPTIALRDMPPTIVLNETVVKIGGVARALMAANLDVRMLCVVSADPGDPTEGGWIEMVDAGGLIPGTLIP